MAPLTQRWSLSPSLGSCWFPWLFSHRIWWEWHYSVWIWSLSVALCSWLLVFSVQKPWASILEVRWLNHPKATKLEKLLTTAPCQAPSQHSAMWVSLLEEHLSPLGPLQLTPHETQTSCPILSRFPQKEDKIKLLSEVITFWGNLLGCSRWQQHRFKD